MTDFASSSAAQPLSPSATENALVERLDAFRWELNAHCYRMLGASSEAEDAVQETFVRAWRHHESFEERSSLRTWVYRIATNVCLDMAGSRQRRARPMDLEAASTAATPLRPPVIEGSWLEPIPDPSVLPIGADPAQIVDVRDSVRLAFVAALQFLPPRQRAVLLLREVLRFRADEVAELLDTSVASVNSALQRARATLDERAGSSGADHGTPLEPTDAAQREMLERYVDAFQRYDMESLTSLLHEDATQSMPPFAQWMAGREEIFEFWQGPGEGCRGSRLLPTVANGLPAFAQYKPTDTPGLFSPWAIQVLHIVDGRIAEFSFFLDTETLFPIFGMPDHLTEGGAGFSSADRSR